jgi:hypothetical protein
MRLDAAGREPGRTLWCNAVTPQSHSISARRTARKVAARPPLAERFLLPSDSEEIRVAPAEVTPLSTGPMGDRDE